MIFFFSCASCGMPKHEPPVFSDGNFYCQDCWKGKQDKFVPIRADVITVEEAVIRCLQQCFGRKHFVFETSGLCRCCGQQDRIRFGSCRGCSRKTVTDFIMVWEISSPDNKWQCEAAKN